MSSPTHGLYMPDEHAREAAIADAQDELAQAESMRKSATRKLRQLGTPVADTFTLDCAGHPIRIELPAAARVDAVVRGEAANVLERAAAELRAEGRRVVAEDAGS